MGSTFLWNAKNDSVSKTPKINRSFWKMHFCFRSHRSEFSLPVIGRKELEFERVFFFWLIWSHWKAELPTWASVTDFGVAKEKSTAQGQQDCHWNQAVADFTPWNRIFFFRWFMVCGIPALSSTLWTIVTFKEGVSYYKDKKIGERNSNK